MDISSYISGYVDGEGCFCITFNRSRRHKFGWDIRPSFSVSQNGDRREVIDLMKQFFRCGFIRADTSDRTVKFEVRNVGLLVDRIIPHFEKFPIVSGKRKDFEVFSEICRMMYAREHLTLEGFNRIARLAEQMNPLGKKRYPRDKIKV